jgi:hypothetical protein
MHAHWGTFTLDTPHWNALKFIDALMRENHESPYDVIDPGTDGEFQIIGRALVHDLVTTVVCVPLARHSTWVSVTVAGPDGRSAQQERNFLRQEIIDLHLD